MTTTTYFVTMALVPPFDPTPLNPLRWIMAMLLPLAIIGLVLVLLAFFAYHHYRQEKKRTVELQRAADELGFEFLPAGDSSFLSTLSGFNLLSRGHGKRLFNLMRGKTKNLDVSIFDYDYSIKRGRHHQTLRQTVVCFQLDGAYLPAFFLGPENAWHKIGAWFGYQDINFAHHPVFSKNYSLRGQEEEAIRNLFTEEVLSFYETNPRLSTESNKKYLLVYRPLVRVEPSAIRLLLEDGLNVMNVFRLRVW